MHERYIGMFDMLGFKHLIETNSLDEVVTRARRFLRTAYGVLKIPGEAASSRLTVNVFQDTVIVTSLATEPEDFKYIVEYSSALIGFGFREGFMLRGAIVTGEVHIEGQMLIGKGIVKAYQMEQSQEWMGCWVETESVEKADSKTVEDLKQGFLVHYSIPLKTGLKRKLWALNWTLPLVYAGEGVLERAWDCVWRPSCEDGTATWDARRKLETTDRFIGEIARRGWLAQPKSHEVEPTAEEVAIPDPIQ